MSIAFRRYRVIDGRMKRSYHIDVRSDPDWFLTKAEAWAAVAPAAEPALVNLGTFKAEVGVDDYASWKMPALRDELKARTGKGPNFGTKKTAMIEALQDLDASGRPALA